MTKARCLSKSYNELVSKILPNWKFPSLKLYIPSEFISLPDSNQMKIIFDQTKEVTIILGEEKGNRIKALNEFIKMYSFQIMSKFRHIFI